MSRNKMIVLFLVSMTGILFICNLVLLTQVANFDQGIIPNFSDFIDPADGSQDYSEFERRGDVALLDDSSSTGGGAKSYLPTEKGEEEIYIDPDMIWVPPNSETVKYRQERHCSAELLDSEVLEPYFTKPCNAAQTRFLERVESKYAGLGEFDLGPSVIGPEPELICHQAGEEPRKYTYVRAIDPGCMCDLARDNEPDTSKMSAATALPSQREFEFLILNGMKIDFLPAGKVNFLVERCLRAVAKYPQFEHYYRKVDQRQFFARVFVIGKGFDDYGYCLTTFHRLTSCPNPKQFGTIRFTSQSIGNKGLLPTTLKNYELLHGKKCFDRHTLIPQTYRLDLLDECNDFWNMVNGLSSLEDEFYGRWMSKNSEIHRGKAVELMFKESLEQLTQEFDSGSKCGMETKMLTQQYLINPLLVRGHKFDLRTYFFLASCSPKIAYFDPFFYARLAASPYSRTASDPSVALTNRSLAQRLGVNLDDVIYPYLRFQKYFYDEGTFSDPDWLEDVLYPQFRRIFVHLARNLDFPEECDVHSHKLYGVDFMVLDTFELRMIEVNPGPMLDAQPKDVNRGAAENAAKIITQKILVDKISTKTLKPGRLEPIYDETLPPLERSFGLLDDSCFEHELSKEANAGNNFNFLSS